MIYRILPASFPPGESASAHKHEDMVEVFFIESGTGLIDINGKQYPLKAGHCIMVQAGESHELINSGEYELIITYFGIKL